MPFKALSPCPRCQSNASTVRYDFGREKILHCCNCTLLYLHPWPAPGDLAEVYADSYFENRQFLDGDNHGLFGYVDYIGERFNKQPQYASIAREIIRLLPSLDRQPRLLEAGCGFGYFLSEAFEEGFAVTGLEFNAGAVARLRQKYAFPILHGGIEATSLQPNGYDCIAMFDVIEHLLDPFGALNAMHEALTPGGLLVVTTVDAESLVSRALGKRLEDFRRTREHLVFFSRATLRDVLAEHGYDTLEIRAIGHTFELAFLLDRLALYNKPLFSRARRLIDRIGLGKLQLSINPRTKMIAFARKRARAQPAAGSADAPPAPSDVTLLEELATLETAAPRHYRWVFDIIEPYLGDAVLEVGSGIGTMSKFMIPRARSLLLTDRRPVYLDRLRERFGLIPNVRYDLLDLNEPPYNLDGFAPDTIVCLNVLEHIERDDTVIRAFADALPPGGRLILQVPNYPRLFGSLDESYGHYRRYSRVSLQAMLERAGFRVKLLRRFNPFSIPGWILSGKVLRTERLHVTPLRTYDALVPLLRAVDALSRIAGLALIACAEKTPARPSAA